MYDVNAFERQVADEAVRMAGPSERVDDAVIFAAVTAGQSPTWRVQPLFGAARFVVAATIVALFGGFLLAGVLTTQPEETGPAVGATASPRATPTQPVQLPAEIPDGVDSGTLDTPLGPARWVHLRGDDATLPFELDAVPVSTGGFIARDGAVPARLWRSPDLITWAAEPLPMAVELRYGGLTLADDTVWLAAYEPALWRSQDSLEWTEVGLEELVPPEPAGPWLLDLGTPLTFDDVTVVPFHHRAYLEFDPTLRRPGLHGEPWCCRRESEPGVYGLRSDDGKLLYRVRFEDADGGLRVIDVDDGRELTFLDGVGLGFIELLASSDGQADVPGLAVLEQGGLVPVGLPDAIRELSGTGYFVDDAGFVVYGLARDGLVHVHRSEDGLTWTETDIVGDDPDEPPDIEGVGSWLGSPRIEQHNNTTWTQADDGSWTSTPHRAYTPGGFPFAGGALRALTDDIEAGDSARGALWFGPDDGEPVSIDPGDELGIVAQIQRDLQSTAGISGGPLFMPLSPNTVVLSYDGGGRRHLWIITFDELAG
jgi:hypothetical protein